MSSDSPALRPDEKRAALDEVLRSASFARADQLRSFLRYVCEMELAGRADDLNEYRIGVEALGKPESYSTTEDATVRRRAHELREKLEGAYAAELADARIRIDLPKGRYVPRFLPRVEPAPTRPPEVGARPRGRRWLGPALWMAVGGLLTWFAQRSLAPRAGRLDPILTEAWGPFVTSGAHVTIGIAAPAHYNVLPYPDGPLPPGVRLVPEEWNLRDWYHGHYPLRPGHRLGLHLSGPLRTGEVLGAMTAARVLMRAGVEHQVILDKKLALSTVRGRNLLMFANPEYSELAAMLLERGVWTVGYDPARRARVIHPHKDAPTQYKAFVPGSDWQRPATFGLITVLPNGGTVVPSAPGNDAGPRAVLVSCTNSPGCQAAMDFFASAGGMRTLRDRLRVEGHQTFPAAYQVVIRCDLHLSQALAGAYEAHAVLPAS
jgi:hypothetical protein